MKPYAKPFLRWAGGKARLLPKIQHWMPYGPRIERYIEPFVGGGAVFFAFANRIDKAYLSDINRRLINAYQVVKDRPVDLCALLGKLADEHEPYYDMLNRPGRELFEKVKKRLNVKRGYDKADMLRAAADFIYINRVCYNGLWRENAKGEFNSTLDPSRPARAIRDKRAIDWAHCALDATEAEIACTVFSSPALDDKIMRIASEAKRGNTVIYCDPPYDQHYNSYSSDRFTREEQQRLRDLCVKWRKLYGAHVIVSNSNTDFIRSLYEKDFDMYEAGNKYILSGKTEGRREVKELLMVAR